MSLDPNWYVKVDEDAFEEDFEEEPMNTQQKIREVLNKTALAQLVNYGFPRQVGHTTALLEGAKATGAVVIAGNAAHANILRKDKVSAISAFSPLETQLRGNRKPVVVDHFALEVMWQEAVDQATAQIMDLVDKEVKTALEKKNGN